MTETSLEDYRKQLVEAADRLSRELLHLEAEAIQPSGGEASGGLSDTPTHPGDLGSREFEEEVTLGLVAQEERLLAEVQAALERVERGDFGRCEGCQTTINRTRLRALPYARHCLACARKLEGSGTQRG
jgi:RNA polymerase-binding transcription factor DksA